MKLEHRMAEEWLRHVFNTIFAANSGDIWSHQCIQRWVQGWAEMVLDLHVDSTKQKSEDIATIRDRLCDLQL